MTIAYNEIHAIDPWEDDEDDYWEEGFPIEHWDEEENKEEKDEEDDDWEDEDDDWEDED